MSVTKTLSTVLNNRLVVQPPKSADSNRIAVLTDHMVNVLKEYRENEDLLCPIIFHIKSGNYLNVSRPQMWLHVIYKANPQLKKHITIHVFFTHICNLKKGRRYD